MPTVEPVTVPLREDPAGVLRIGDTIGWGNIAKETRKEIRRGDNGLYGLTIHNDGPEGWQPSWSAETGTHVGGSKVSDPFRMLVRWIRQGPELGRTSDIRSFDRYLETKPPPGPTTCLAKRETIGADEA